MAEKESNTDESDSFNESGETEIKASLGMMALEIHTSAGIEEAQDTFEEIWEGRVEEIEESHADTLRRELEEEQGVFMLGD